jgi:membrane protease YdiL (CAAX protease family)
MKASALWPIGVGLVIAIGGPALLVSPLHRFLGDAQALPTRLLDQLILWGLFGAIMALVVFWERRPLTSIGWHGLRWSSFAWGLVLCALYMWVLTPVGVWLIQQLDLGGFNQGFNQLVGVPRWFLVFAAITAGVVEETLFRGYALERIGELTGSYSVAGITTLTIFALVHLPFWGWGTVVALLISGAVGTAFYVWRHDLLALVVAHALTDTVGLLFLTPRA